jgi:Sec-independent protein translocase protein TatA
MTFLGVGWLEFFFILLLLLIVVGPRDLSKIARQAGRFLHRIYHSEAWKTITQASREIKTLPDRLVREAELEELEEIRRTAQTVREGMKRDLEEIRKTTQDARGDMNGEMAEIRKEVEGLSKPETEEGQSSQGEKNSLAG